jgi:hypothetical protein
MPRVVRNFTGFSAALDEIASARVFGGIHFRNSCVVGQALGAAVADYVTAHALLPVHGEHLKAAIVNQSKVGMRVQMSLELVNAGTTVAHGVSLNVLVPKTLAGAGTISMIGPGLPMILGDIQPGASSVLSVILSVPDTIKKLSLTEDASFIDDSSNINAVSLSQVVIP